MTEAFVDVNRARRELSEIGGEKGIRTLGTVSRTHAFQACSFNHSDISPFKINNLWPRRTPSNRIVSDLLICRDHLRVFKYIVAHRTFLLIPLRAWKRRPSPPARSGRQQNASQPREKERHSWEPRHRPDNAGAHRAEVRSAARPWSR